LKPLIVCFAFGPWPGACFFSKGYCLGRSIVDIGPEFRVLKAGEGPRSSKYILLVHRFSADKRALVHDISGA
jgi:hypothetical protein